MNLFSPSTRVIYLRRHTATQPAREIPATYCEKVQFSWKQKLHKIQLGNGTHRFVGGSALRADGAPADVNADLLAACVAQHDAIDRLMASLVLMSQRHTPNQIWMPSHSGPIWDAVKLANAAIHRATNP